MSARNICLFLAHFGASHAAPTCFLVHVVLRSIGREHLLRTVCSFEIRTKTCELQSLRLYDLLFWFEAASGSMVGIELPEHVPGPNADGVGELLVISTGGCTKGSFMISTKSLRNISRLCFESSSTEKKKNANL